MNKLRKLIRKRHIRELRKYSIGELIEAITILPYVKRIDVEHPKSLIITFDIKDKLKTIISIDCPECRLEI